MSAGSLMSAIECAAALLEAMEEASERASSLAIEAAAAAKRALAASLKAKKESENTLSAIKTVLVTLSPPQVMVNDQKTENKTGRSDVDSFSVETNKNEVNNRISNNDNKEILEDGQQKVTEEIQFFPYYCPVCPTKKLISPNNVDSHINGKSHQKLLIMQKSGKYKSNNIASSAKSIKSAEENRGHYVPFYCTVCPSKLVHPLNADNHFMGEIHKNYLMEGQGKAVNKLTTVGIEQELSKVTEEVNSTEGMEGKRIELAEIKMKSNKSYARVVLESSNKVLKSIWECKRCSYHNLPEDQTCLMCSNVRNPWKQETNIKAKVKKCFNCKLGKCRHGKPLSGVKPFLIGATVVSAGYSWPDDEKHRKATIMGGDSQNCKVKWEMTSEVTSYSIHSSLNASSNDNTVDFKFKFDCLKIGENQSVSEDQNPQKKRLSIVSRLANVQNEIWEHHGKEIPSVMLCASENIKLQGIDEERK